ncbi:PREDICTED: probably inactive leucine-rich repeat receptor-like protein kinase At5g48380 [Nicotiana attenuata]|uniref:non-specific serine/threonine protein kinase n=1 Tax=Nicotiana attenuata TaxID=49451 RepID=A0A1J6IMG0_NICAT|nr:PREDICTED: probably inactive leucine-rich repeat receptor-like protein kinase At5g48380 [Nicotiana attenuata]OIS96336.1 Putative inactive leucine-rich repeat receptor-like protein kinase [Nicotiana attenuata]
MEKSNSFFFIWTFLAFLLILLSRIYVCSAAESDFYCLKSIKDSLQDPFNNLGSWDFSNATEGIICRFSGINCWHVNENKVLSITLSNYGLIGEFPRGVRNCTSLTSLDLSGNKLYGNIPSDISVIVYYLITLDLSNNTFSGNIPPDIANCTYLNVLRLDNNNLEGEIPSIIGSLLRLQTFSVANNYLTGAVPLFVNAQITAKSFENNPELCGKPLKGCEDSWIWKHIDRASFIKAFVVGWVLFFTLGLVLHLFQFPSKVINKIVSFNKWKLRVKEHLTSGSDSPGEEDLSSNQKILRLEKFVTRMSFAELEKATSGFSENYLVGNGMLGKVYKAILPNGWTLAIKKLNEWENLEDEFVSEITTLGGLRHRNLLPLIGFCTENEKKLLVYKYMPNGSLHEWLHSTGDKVEILDFPLRVKLALGIAKGLAWLHHGYELHVTHGSISTRCILLDQNFEPKISNFWEAKFWSKNETALSWSLFPVAEYSGLGSYKQDIYCFGVVLLELVTGKEPHELTSSRNLFDHSPCLLDADRNLLGKGVDDLILQFLELACNCVKFFPNERPTMLEVYDTLRTISQGRTDWVREIPLSTDMSSLYD